MSSNQNNQSEKINQKLADRVRLAAQGAQAKKGFWESTMRNISKGNVIPIISNSFRLEQIFRDLAGGVNQRLAARADRVWLVTAGLPLQLK